MAQGDPRAAEGAGASAARGALGAYRRARASRVRRSTERGRAIAKLGRGLGPGAARASRGRLARRRAAREARGERARRRERLWAAPAHHGSLGLSLGVAARGAEAPA